MAIYIGHVSAYAIAKANGYEGTEEEFGAMLGQISITLGDLTNLRAVATTRAAGSQATASYADGVLTLGIPRGDKGETGNGIQSVAKTGTSGTNPVVDTYTITYTNGQTTTFQITNGIKGDTGATPELTIGTVTTGEVGSDAAATITGTPEHPVLDLTLPRGATGDVTNLAGTFSSASAYSAGDYVIYNDLLYVFTSDHAAGSWTGTDAAQVKVGTELSALKEDIKDNYAKNDGYYDGMTVGNAEQIVGTVFEEDDTAYNYRTTGGSAEVGDRAYVDAIVGGSLPWNQLVTNGNFESTTGWRAWTPSLGSISASNNVLTHTITPSGSHYSYEYAIVHEFAFAQASHKHFVSVTVEPSVATQFYIDLGGTQKKSAQLTANAKNTVCCITDAYTASRSLTLYPNSVAVEGTSSMTMKYSNAFIIDLTAMFGATIADYIYSLETAHAGDGVAWFRRYFPKPYYAYHAVGMEHVNAVSAKTVGFNQCNDVPAVGWTYDSGVLKGGANTLAATKSKIKCLPNIDYCLSTPNNDNTQNRVVIVQFDAEENWLRNKYIDIGTQKYGVLTTDSDCWYFASLYYSNSGDYSASDFEDFCVSIHWDNSRDGDYEPYNLHTYPLADLTLRGIPKKDESGNLYFDGDRYLPDGTVERNKAEITFDGSSDENWGVNSNNDNCTFMNIGLPNSVSVTNADTVVRCVASNLVGSPASGTNGAIGSSTPYLCAIISSNRLYVTMPVSVVPADSSAVSAFKTWLAAHPVTVVYDLATPTTEEADPYQYPMVVDNWGTEELIDGLVESGDRDVAIPVGHETKYPPNLKDKLESAANNPDADGAYILTHDGGSNVYTPLASNATIQDIIARLEALEGGGE